MKRFKKIFSLILAALMFLGIMTTEKIYAVDYTVSRNPILEPWSNTILDLNRCTSMKIGKNFTKTLGVGSSLYVAYNQTKNEENYVFYENAAYRGNQSYDLKVYFWCSNANGYAVRADKAFGDGITSRANTLDVINDSSKFNWSLTNIFDIEMHFYKHGEKVEDPNFKGVLWWQDLDTSEGIKIISGVKDCYRFPGTTVNKRDDGWYMGTIASEEVSDKSRLAVLTTTNSGIIHIKYDAYKSQGTNYGQQVSKIDYVLSSLSEYRPNETVFNDSVIKYGEYTLQSPEEEIQNYEFFGWYKDNACTQKITRIDMVSNDTTVYGKYIEKPKITTEVINGRIDPDILGIDKGSNKTINYSPTDGYYLKSITVDGVTQDITKFPNKYVFFNVISDHHIKVVYEKNPERPITITKIWEDKNNIYFTRPNSLNIDILKDGVLHQTVTLNSSNALSTDSNKWQTTINVPKYDNLGKEITYTIKENENDTNLKFFYEKPIYDQSKLEVLNKATFIPDVMDEFVDYKIIIKKDILNSSNQIATKEDFDKVSLDFDDTYNFPITLKQLNRTVSNTGTELIESYSGYSGKEFKGILTDKGDLIFNLGSRGYGKYEISESINQYFDFIDIEKVNDKLNSNGATFTKENGKYYITLSGITGQYEQITVKVKNQLKPDRPYNDREDKINLFR